MNSRSLPVDLKANYGPLRMQIYAVGLPVTISSVDRLPSGMLGCYIEDLRTILIDRRIPYTAKRCTLVHELIHWLHADATCGRHEQRTRWETARRLIDPAEYALAEQVYDGDVYLMAEELNVTPQIINDYRQWLHETVRR